MKYIKKFEDTHYLNINLGYEFEFVIDIKNASQNLINLAFEKFEEYTELSNWIKKYLVSTDNGGKVWAWRINLHKSYFNWEPSINFNIITTVNWGIGNVEEVDNRITIEEFLKVGLEGAKEYIKSGNTYFKILNKFGYSMTSRALPDITPKEFLEVGLNDIENYIEMKKNAEKFNI